MFKKVFFLFLLAAFIVPFNACKKEETVTPSTSKTYVLIHGAWHGKWAWTKLQTELEARGHKVIAIDLPGHGDDTTPLQTVTIDAYVQRVGQVVQAQTEKVVLVGHSMGGLVISQVAEQYGNSIESLIYVAAFLPQSGESLLSIEGRNPAPTVPPALIPSADQSYLDIDPSKITSLFYQDCTEADIAFAKARLTSQATAPLATPVTLTDEKFGKLPRFYVECTNDQAVNIALQRDMYTATPCQKVYTLASGHSPFFSVPVQLADALEDAARQEVK